jgi:hypothetical protein
MSTFYQSNLAMRNAADVIDGKSIAIWSQFISVVNTVYSLNAVYGINGRKGDLVLFTKQIVNLFIYLRKTQQILSINIIYAKQLSYIFH